MEPDDKFKAFFRVMDRFGKLAASSVPTGEMTKGEFFCMGAICGAGREEPEKGGIYVWELARRTRTLPPAVSRILRDLERRGYIERSVDREDRRNVKVRPTAEGLAIWERAEENAKVFLQRVLGEMGEADMEQLVTLCSWLCDIIEKEQSKPEKGDMA
ncbi:putative Transcriptional regulator, MarR family [uncultured Eubacteriales bacterium]|uniref:Putative Transcriptional regulator, MarR family n=1 Tax=uncultured Eubacteriales bacterium TaxID=172733 RepID=A0A212K9A9_9FIRM|nr:putative Transcriptional regulator, MarR family [uncultured Eubacteriales bacterium]